MVWGERNEISVLHIDDDPALTELVGEYLEREDERLSVRSARSAREALEVLDDADVDCIVSDYAMPGEDGIAFLETVREEAPDLPFVLFTGKGSEEVASEAIEAGVTTYLRKETGTEQYAVLATHITNAVESHRSRKTLGKRTEALRRYEHVIDSMLEGACIYDENGHFDVVNDRVAEWYGTTTNELEGEPSTLVSLVREQHDGDPYQALLDGERETIHGEIEAEFPDHGHAVLEYRLTPVAIDGSVHGVVGVTRDITERREHERRMQRLSERLELAVEGANTSYSSRKSKSRCSNSGTVSVASTFKKSSTEATSCRVAVVLDTLSAPWCFIRDAFYDRLSVSVIRDVSPLKTPTTAVLLREM